MVRGRGDRVLVQGTGRPAVKQHTPGRGYGLFLDHKPMKPRAYALGPARGVWAQASLRLAWAVSLPFYFLWFARLGLEPKRAGKL